MKKSLSMLLALAAVSMAGVSCDPAENKAEEIFEVSPLTLSVNPEGETKTFSVKSNYSWTASADSWIRLSTTSERGSTAAVTVAAEVGKNAEEAARTGHIVITLSTGTKQEITVTQENFSAPKGLYNAADFAELAAEMAKEESDFSKWTDDKTILIYQDLDLSSLDCFPVSQWPAGYTLDGQGHSITVAMNSSANKVGIFNTLRGTVKNLNLYGTVSASVNAAAQVGALAASSIGSLGSDDEPEYTVTLENVNSYVSISVNGTLDAAKNIMVGGLIGNAASNLSVVKCGNSGSITFSGDANSSHYIGGLVGSYGGTSDFGKCSFKECMFGGEIESNGITTAWNYAGGLVGAAAASPEVENAYVCTDCNVSGNISLKGTAKTRAAGLNARHYANSVVTGCSFSGTISVNGSSNEKCIGGIGGWGETTVTVNIDDCVFSGKIICAADGANAIYCGGMTGSGYSAASIIQNCRSTKDARMEMPVGTSVSMALARGKEAVKVKNCKVAGTIVNNSETIVISADNYADWMVTGSGGGSGIAENCGYNDGQ